MGTHVVKVEKDKMKNKGHLTGEMTDRIIWYDMCAVTVWWCLHVQQDTLLLYRCRLHRMTVRKAANGTHFRLPDARLGAFIVSQGRALIRPFPRVW